MDNKELAAEIEDALEGKWKLLHDEPTQYLHFIKSLNEEERGKVIMAYSEDFSESRRTLEYDVIYISKDMVKLNFYVKTSEEELKFKVNLVNSYQSLRLDTPDGRYLHYEKIPNQ